MNSVIGRGFDNDRIGAHFEVVNTRFSMGCLTFHKQTILGSQKRSEGLCLKHGLLMGTRR